MLIINDDDGQVKKLGKRKDDTPVDPTLQALQGLTKAVERIKAIQPVVINEGDGTKHAEVMGVLLDISHGINQLSKQLVKKDTTAKQIVKKDTPGKWHFELIRDRAGHITSVEATKK
jgi:hypothetical protein